MPDDERARALGIVRGPPEDCVFYEIYCDDSAPDKDSSATDDLLQKLLERAEALTRDYIWQKDGFDLRDSSAVSQPWLRSKSRATKDAATRCFWGQTRFGDNIEDEWLVVWLLLGLTRAEKRLSARLWDTDGEFLLIEAAYALPAWLKPENADNRVWLRDGALQLIPQPSREHPMLPSSPSLPQALQLLHSEVDTRAPSQMQAAIAARLSEYPQQIASSIHRAGVVLPRALAGVLQHDSRLVAPAVLAFHYRDARDTEGARKMTHFSAEDLTETVVRFSRCLYAQILNQQYDAPVAFHMPLPSDPSFAAAQLGAKLTAGFEMLMMQAAEANNADGTAAHIRDVERNPGWEAFMQKLADEGFFGEARIGTHHHDELLAEAARRFKASNEYVRGRASSHEPAARLQALLDEEASFDPAEVKDKPESDAWLADGIEEVERQLKSRQAEKNGDEQTPAADSAEMAARFKDFLSREAEFDGAEVDEAPSPPGSSGQEDGPVTADEQAIWREMDKILHFQDRAKDARAGSESEGSSFYGEYSDGDEGSPLEGRGEALANEILTGGGPSKRKAARETSKAASRPKVDARDDLRNPGGEVETETDSDDEADYFGAAYEDALLAEMREHDIKHPASGPPTANGNAAEEELAPLDLDMNLVQNLLASYEAQEGLPGPVGNLFGMMGLNLPHEGRGEPD